MAAFRDESPVCAYCLEPIQDAAKTFGQGCLHPSCQEIVRAAYFKEARAAVKRVGVRCSDCGHWRERVLAFLSNAFGTIVIAGGVGLSGLGLVTCARQCDTFDYCRVEANTKTGKFALHAERHGLAPPSFVGEFDTIDDALVAAKKLNCPVK